ncbi:MAG: spore gernimation protein [Peptococcaceae bacterium BICA1-8]|nr:MAG: spore gernimation protein [Peptococcaceae bacterium BICA1-8]
MLEDGRITYKQLIYLIFITRITLTFTYLPALTSPPKNQDVWLSGLLSFPIQLLFAVPVYLLWKRFPSQSIIQYSQSIVGKAGKLIGVLYVWFIIHFTAITLCQFCKFLTTAVAPETPMLFFGISLTLFCAYAARNGVEVMGRMSEIIAPIIMIASITIVVLLAKDMNLEVFTPVLEKGFLPVLHGGFTIAARSVEIIGIAMVLPYLNDRKKAKTVFIFTFLLRLIFFLIITITILAIFGVEEVKNRLFSFFSAVRLVSIGGFLERIESVHMGIWVLGVFIKITFYYYLAVLGMGQLFNLKDYRPLILPVGTIIIPLGILIGPSIVELKEFTSYKIFTWYSLFFMVFIPSILLFIAIFRKKGVRQK